MYAEVPSISRLLAGACGWFIGGTSYKLLLLVVAFRIVFSVHQAKYHHRKHFVSCYLHPCVEYDITASPCFSIRVLASSHLCWLFILVAIVRSVRQKTIHISDVL